MRCLRGVRAQQGLASLLGVVVLLALAGSLVMAAWQAALLQQRIAHAAFIRARLLERADNALALREASAVREAARSGRCAGSLVLEERATESTGRKVRMRATFTLREGPADKGWTCSGRPMACCGRRSAWARVE